MAGQDRRFPRSVAPMMASTFTRRQALIGAAAAALAVPTIGALGADAAPSTQNRGLTSANATTNLEFYHDKANWQDFFTAMSDASSTALDISFEPIPYSDTTSYQQVINSSLTTDDAPDLFTWWSGYRMEDMYKSGGLLDVTDIWTAAVAAGDLPESLASAFTFDGKQYAVPQSSSYWVVFYNKKVFADNSIAIPTTWAELMTAADTLKAADVTPFFATVDGRWPSFIWWEELLIRSDPQFYRDLCEGKAKYTDPQAVAAIETWKGMIDKEYFTDLDLTMDENFVAMFQNGEVAMIPVGTWFQQSFITADMVPGEDFDAFILPNVNPDLATNVAIVETGSICIPAAAQNLEASKAVATWWDQVDAQTQWSTLLGDAGANPKVTHDNPVLTNVANILNEGSYELLQRYWEATPPAIVENAVDELARFMLNPDEGQSVLEAIQKIADAEWAKREA